jgi:VHL beta domain
MLLARPFPISMTIAAVLAAGLSAAAVAQDGMQWQFSEFNDPDNKGRMTARLAYGVPETDNIQVSGVCDASPSTGVKFSSVTFGADTGDLKEGDAVELYFSGGGFKHTLQGSVYGTQAEVGVSGVHADIEHDDPIWKAMQEQEKLEYFVPGSATASLQLKGGAKNIKSFVDACRTYAEVILGDGGGSEAKPENETDPKTKPKPKKEAARPAGGSAEKDAYEAAKELGTVEAWEAFLNSYPSGFRADLARAYMKKLGGKSGSATRAEPPAAAAGIATGRAATKVSCSAQGKMRSKNSNTPTKITFVNESGSYRSIMWLDFKGTPKPYANLNDGEQVTLETFLTHPWMATDGPGNCIEIVVPRAGSSVATLGSETQGERPAWQREAIAKGCKPGLAWNAQEGCHEND